MCLEQQFLILVLVVKKIMTTLNNQLEMSLNSKKNKKVRMKTTVLRVRNIYEKTWEITLCMNTIFAMPLLMWILHLFVDMIIGIFFFIIALLDHRQSEVNPLQIVIGASVWSPIVIIRTFNLCWAGNQVKSEFQRLGCILQKHTSSSINLKISEEVKLFSQLLFHQKIEFQVCGLSTLDLNLLVSMYGAIMTYVVILIQFHNANMFQDSLTTF